jgi:serine/threonine-protein kinase
MRDEQNSKALTASGLLPVEAATGGRHLSHYLLEERIGAGGMGEVYRARDIALGRLAAIKLIPPGLSPELRSRLLREASAAARLQHPAIATFFEAGEADGEAFIAMEYVSGSTLRETLRGGPLPRERAIAGVACVLEGLAHAHAAGILHRDIKPENVMVTGEQSAKLLDFGLAKSLFRKESSTEAATEIQLTEEGMILGTVGYMSPEQIQGSELDERSDLFAVGALLYEALCGKPAFPGRTATERLAAILTRNVDPLEATGVTPELWDVVSKGLERDLRRRYSSARAFLSDLSSLGSGRIRADLPETIAVLELENLSGREGDGWVGTGVAESVATDLARIPGLTVFGRERVRAAAVGASEGGRPSDPSAIGQKLGCRWVVSGSFQKAGEALRVFWRLVEVSTGSVLASERSDGKVDEIFAIEDRIAAGVAAALQVSAPVVSGVEPELPAYEFYARGREAFDRLGKGSLEQAHELFEKAIATEPSYAPALTGLAAVHAMKFTFTTNPAELEAAADFARRAIDADSRLGEPHIWLGYSLFRQGRLSEAIEEEILAERLDPANHFAPYFRGCALTAAVRKEEALAAFQRTIELNPRFAFAWLGLGMAHLDLERMAEAKWSLDRAVTLERDRVPGAPAGVSTYLAECLRRGGSLDRARSVCLEALEDTERSDHMYRDTLRGFALCTLGRIALEQSDPEAAAAAFSQAVSQIRGRPRALGVGQLLVQALAGLASTGREAARLDEALDLFEKREGYDFQFFWGTTDDVTLWQLSRAAESVGRAAQALDLLSRARKAGWSRS